MSDSVARLSVALADRYVIERELGAGGMATVYLAHDVRHDRKVALKVLRPELSAILGGERFLAEIKTTANLQHPHILSLYDSGEADGLVFYVMPYVEGESLRDRITREKQLPVDDAIRIAREVADALDYAHRHKVVHRDIKPENILLHDGRALVADFGIALAVSRSDGNTRMTETGMSLGTPHYMSPEQAMGEREITARSDVYALGCVLYEMLTGEPPFTGPTAQAIIARVMTEEPRSLTLQRRTIPPHVEAVVRKSLEKLPADRFASAAQFAEALANPAFRTAATAAQGGAVAALRSSRAAMAGWGAAALLALAAGGLLLRGRGAAPEPVARFEIAIPGVRGVRLTFSGGSIAIAPDGSRIAYVGIGERGRSQLWVRDRDALETRAMDGTLGADAPFFSPDGQWIAFFANGLLKKIPVGGGAPVVLADSASTTIAGGAWSDDGFVYYDRLDYTVMRVAGSGGAPEAVARSEANRALALPAALPGGRAILISACSNNCASMAVMALDLRSGATKLLVDGAARGWYVPTGDLVYARTDGTVYAAPFDPGALELRGPAAPVLSGVQVSQGIIPEMAISDNGTLIYQPALGGGSDVRAVRVDLSGRVTPLDTNWSAQISTLALSPDGRRLAVSVVEAGRTDIWVKQLDNGPLSRMTFEGALNYRPAWTADGRYLSFQSDRSGFTKTYRVRSDGGSAAERLIEEDTSQVDETVFSRDGRWLVYRVGTADGVRDIRAIRPGVDSVPRVVIGTRFDEYAPALSPDGRWLAYVSVESGREEVYVRAFPEGEGRWQVSTAGAASPVWSPDGRQLYYLAGNAMTAVAVAPGPAFSAGPPRTLFTMPGMVVPPFHQCFVVTPDGRGFIALQTPLRAEAGGRLVVVLNWFEELRARAAR